MLPNSVTVLVLLKPGGLRRGHEGLSTVCTKFGNGGGDTFFRPPRFKPRRLYTCFSYTFCLHSEQLLGYGILVKRRSPPPTAGTRVRIDPGANVRSRSAPFPPPLPRPQPLLPRAAPSLLAAAGEQFPSIPPPSSQDVHIRTSASAGFHGWSLRPCGGSHPRCP